MLWLYKVSIFSRFTYFFSCLTLSWKIFSFMSFWKVLKQEHLDCKLSQYLLDKREISIPTFFLVALRDTWYEVFLPQNWRYDSIPFWLLLLLTKISSQSNFHSLGRNLSFLLDVHFSFSYRTFTSTTVLSKDFKLFILFRMCWAFEDWEFIPLFSSGKFCLLHFQRVPTTPSHNPLCSVSLSEVLLNEYLPYRNHLDSEPLIILPLIVFFSVRHNLCQLFNSTSQVTDMFNILIFDLVLFKPHRESAYWPQTLRRVSLGNKLLGETLFPQERLPEYIKYDDICE